MENIDRLTLILSSAIFLSPYILKYIKGQNPNTMGSIATSLGILGTFLGIFLGLLNFDVSNLSDSVPQLLNGLKTAFLTSIAGLVSSLILKSFPVIYGIKLPPPPPPAPVDTAVSLLGLTNSTLSRIERAISGDGETTLVTQIKNLRIDTADGLKTLDSSFNEFAKKMADNNTQALIAALEKVMRDFNVLIAEQFGDNFKQLNEAVGKILVWQQEYAVQVEQMTAQFQRTLVGVKLCEEILESISKRTDSAMSDLIQLLGSLHGNLEAMNNIKRNAIDAFPVIQNTINDLTQGFSAAVQRSADTASDAVRYIKKTVEQHQREQLQLTQGMNKYIEDFLKKFHDALEKELNGALKSLGSSLASLSGHFVEDYEPLTKRLRELIQIANIHSGQNRTQNLF
ncbi:MAG: MotA/TolQ/ExbB proton channel family protein [Prevotellaceae bacterium]|jgi:hypothetical protein|nr:MotA/TolQ/ExbB proton channel family protein [Prevotellaceae bacterium]